MTETTMIRPSGNLEIGPLAEPIIISPETVIFSEGFGPGAGTRGWIAGTSTYAVVDPSNGNAAPGCLVLQRLGGAGTAYAIRTLTELEIGRSYTLEAWAKGPAGSSFRVGVDGIGLGSSLASGVTSYVHVTYTFTATATTHDLRLTASVPSTTVTFWDDLKLTAATLTTDTPTLPASNGSVRLNAMAVPYATARVVLPIVDPNLPEMIDPRDGMRATLTAEDEVSGTSRVFDVGVRSRTVDHKNKTIEVELASDEALLIDYAPLTTDTGARTHETSLRAVCNYVLAAIGATLEAGAWDADVTAAWEVTNLLGNPSFETNATGWSSTSLASVTRSTSIAAVFGSGYCNQTSSGAGNAYMQRDERINVRAGETYTLSAYMRPNASGIQGRLIIRWISAEGTTIRESLGTQSSLSTSSWTRFSVTAKAPKNAATARIVVGAAFTAGSQVNRVDAIMFAAGSLTTYVDGSLASDAYYSYAWDDGTDSTSTRTPFNERDPDLFTWEPGVNAWDFLDPFTASTGLRLFCDEQRKWWLIDPSEYTKPGVLTLSQARVTEGTDTIALGDPTVYCTGVVIVYTWTDSNGEQRTRRDSAGTPGHVLVQEIARPWPGPGAAAWMLARREGQGRTQAVTALTDWSASPAMQTNISLPGTLDQIGQVESVEWGLTDGLMDVTARALTDIIPGSIDALVGTIDDAIGTIDDL